MRILVAHFVSPARTGGMSRLVGTIHDRLAAAGHDITYLTAHDMPPAMQSRLGRLGFQFAVWRTAAAAARRGNPYDIINVHEPHGAIVAARRRRLGGAAVVAMTHGVERRGWEIALRHPPSRPGIKTRLVHPILTLAPSSVTLRRADHVICLSTDDREFLMRAMAVPAHRISRVTPGAEPVFGEGATQRPYDQGDRLLFAGTWLPRKGVQELVQAFTSLVGAGHDVHLDVLGAGVDPGVVKAAFSGAAADRVHLRSAGGDAGIAAAMRAASIFVLPSLFEGTPLTLIEAMWSGLPVVTTATAGMKDVVSDQCSGLLVPPGDAAALAAALGRLIGDAALRRRLGVEAHAVAHREYTWERAAATFATAYESARAARG
jgi:glycosyltransferase involved in cell wall biosynthesis